MATGPARSRAVWPVGSDAPAVGAGRRGSTRWRCRASHRVSSPRGPPLCLIRQQVG